MGGGKNKLNFQGIKFLFVNNSLIIISMGHKKSKTVRFNPAGFFDSLGFWSESFYSRFSAPNFSFYFSASFFTGQVPASTETSSKFRSMLHLTKWKESLGLQTVIALVGNSTSYLSDACFHFLWHYLSNYLKRLVSATQETDRKSKKIHVSRLIVKGFYCGSFSIENTLQWNF